MGKAGDSTTVVLLNNKMALVLVRALVGVVVKDWFTSHGHR